MADRGDEEHGNGLSDAGGDIEEDCVLLNSPSGERVYGIFLNYVHVTFYE